MNLWWLGGMVLVPSVVAASGCGSEGEYLFSKNSDSVVYQQVSAEPGESFDRSIAWVSVPTFEVIERNGCETDYAKDVNKVYYKGAVVEDVKPKDFMEANSLPGIWEAAGKWIKDGRVISDLTDFGNGYYQAGGQSFYEGNILPHPLQEVLGHFGITDQKIFYKGTATDFDPNTFKAFKHYALDAYKLRYYVGSEIIEIPGADAQSFVEYEDQKLLAADYEQFYFEGHVIPSSSDYIEYYSHGFFRDENQVYFYETPLPGIDPDTFRVHLKAGKFIQDKNGAYYIKRLNFRFAEIDYEPLPGPIDYESFKVVRYNVAHDKDTVFETSNLANFTRESLNLGPTDDYQTTPLIRFEKPDKPSLIKLPPSLKAEKSQGVPRLFSNVFTTENSKQKVPRMKSEASIEVGGLEVKLTWWQRLLNWLLF